MLLAGAVWLLGGSLLLSAKPEMPPSSPVQSRDMDERISGCWESVYNVSNSAEKSRVPSIAVTSAGRVHIVWEEGRYLYHAYWNGNSWSDRRRITIGEQPTLAIDHNDVPHLVFVNEFRGNYEIYYSQWNGISWTLPRNVSSTSGVSAIPDVAIDSRNTLHVVWADNSPGYNVIYYGRWTGTFWINRPIPNARGSVPAIAIGADDLIHVVWQDRDILQDPYEIYHSQYDDITWTLPENLSDSENHSTIPDIQVSPDGLAHVTWEERVEEQDYIFYCGGQSFLWSNQEPVSGGETSAYLPAITVDAYGFIHLAWDASDHLAYRWHLDLVSPWVAARCIAENGQGVADVALAAGPDGAIHAAWAERMSDTVWDIFYAAQPSVFRFPLQLPLIVRTGF